MVDETQDQSPAQDQMSATTKDETAPETPVQSDAPETAQSTTQDVVTDQTPATVDGVPVSPGHEEPVTIPHDEPELQTPWSQPAIPAQTDENGNAIHTPAPTGSNVPTISAEDAAANPALASQPPTATVIATPDGDKPSQIVQVEQPELIPDPENEGAQIPNPNLVKTPVTTGAQTPATEVPAPINPDAIGPTPAPITHEEAVAHIAQQQAEPAIASAEPTHESILTHLIRDLEGVAAMGKSEIVALIDMAKARLDEL